jgi:hypothetical protein
VLAATLSMLMSSLASADIINVTGNGDKISPASGGALPDFFNDPGPTPKIHGWDEAQGVTLTKDVYVDITTSGTYDAISQLAGFKAAKVAAGTVVDSHLLYFDPLTGADVKNVTFTFSGKILGVIVESDRFYNLAHGNTDYYVSSDFLRNALTPAGNYPTSHFNNRGLELGSPSDKISVSISGNTVTVDDFSASSPGDQVRVLTTVPEPSTALALGIPLIILSATMLRRKEPVC